MRYRIEVTEIEGIKANGNDDDICVLSFVVDANPSKDITRAVLNKRNRKAKASGKTAKEE